MRVNPDEAMTRARTAASKALELDPYLAEAHVSLALVKTFYDWDWEGAEHEFAQALALTPGNADVHLWYGVYLGLLGWPEPSRTELEKARSLDPLSLMINNAMGLPSYFTGRYSEAIAWACKTLELDPNFYFARTGLASALTENGEYQQAIAEYQRARKLDNSPEIVAFLARACALAGDRGQALRLLRGIETGKNYVSPFDVALVYTALGDRRRALGLLEKAYATHAEGMVSLKVDPRLAPLRQEPQFQALLRRMNFPDRARGH